MNIHDLYAQRCREPSDIVDHLPTLFDMVCRYVEPIVVELGVRSGVSTAALLAAVDKVGGEHWAVDIHHPHLPPVIADHRSFRLLVGDDCAPDIVSTVPDCDVLFVDTSHLYEHTMRELAVWMPKCRGVALFHDTLLQTPDGAGPGEPLFPVTKALNDWCDANGLEWSNFDYCYGLGVVEVA